MANRRMKLRRASLVVAGALGGLAICACGQSPSSAPEGLRAAQADPVIEVTTSLVHRGSIAQKVTAPGSVDALRRSRIGAEVRGRIQKVYVSEGDRVAAGDPLFQIDPEAYEVVSRQAEAGLDLARAQRHQVELDLARARKLRQKDVLAAQEIERLTTSLAVAQARERQAEQAVAMAHFNLGHTVVHAPFSGSVAARLADEGTTALVQPQTIVVVIEETAELEAHATIPESQLSLVRVGDRALVHVEGIGEPIETRISAVADTIDPATRTYLAKMRVPNPNHGIKAGVFARIDILPQPKGGTLVVPREAMRTEDGSPRVLAVRENRAVAVPVNVGIVSEQAVEVLSGLAEGEEVIVGKAAGTIAPGMRVRVVKAAEGPAS